MQIGMNGRPAGVNYRQATQQRKNTAAGSWIASLAEAAKHEETRKAEAEDTGKKGVDAESLLQAATQTEGAEGKTSPNRPEAARIFEAVSSGGENPLSGLRQAGKVPYGYLARDGIIEYNGVVFVCDPKTNSICLGDVSDPKQVIKVSLSGGGHLKVNRKNIGQLSKAAGMFSPEDLNRIMRAIAQDTRIQSMEKEIEDMESSVGQEMGAAKGTGQGEDESR